MASRAFHVGRGSALAHTLNAAQGVFSLSGKNAVLSNGAAFDYYISTTGSDANNGLTPATAWAITSLQATNSHNSAMVGKRVGLIAGTYTLTGMQSSSNPGNYQYSVLAPPFGISSSQPTYIGSSDVSGFESPRAATLQWFDTGTSGIAGCNGGLIGPEYFNSGASRGYITISGLVIDGGNTHGGHLVQVMSDYGNSGQYQTTAVTAPVGIWVKNCEIRNIVATDNGNNDSLVFFRGVNGNDVGGYGSGVTNCYLHDIIKASQADHAHAYEEYASQGVQITFNTIARSTAAIESKGGSSGTAVAYNYITASGYSAICGFDGGTGNPNSPSTAYSIHHNVLDNNGTGINATSPAVSAPGYIGDQNLGSGLGITQAMNYFNNTIYDIRTGGSHAQIMWLVMHGTTFIEGFYNNIVHATSNTGTNSGGIINGIVGIGSYNGTVAGPLTNIDYNCYQLNTFGLGLNSTTYTSLATWKTGTGAEAHSIAGNPTYTGSITSGNGPNQFKLGGSSPCLGVGQGGVNIGAWDGTVTKIGADWAPATP